MQIFGSTSPSFLTLLSLEKCAFWFKNKGKTEFLKLDETIKKIKNKYSDILFKTNLQDPVRLTFDTANIGLSSQEFISHLEKFKVKPEFGINTKTVLIPSPFNGLADFKKLNLALKNISNKNFKLIIEEKNIDFCAKISIRNAIFSKNENIFVKNAENKISAQTVARCPPGIPIVIPGEIINKQKMNILEELGINCIKVVI